ncbi:MAG: hypothetical protein HYU66_07750 [Armatimonadetes bacterium]|nr:hypothetical protein [Armatimonadota bacterium]
MSRPAPLLFAHRGFSWEYPENTVAAFRAGLQLGVDGCETDVHLSRDGVPYLLHDDSLLRTTGADRAGDALTWAEIETLDAGACKDARFAGERIPTLRAALDLHANVGVLIIEIKPHGDPAAVADAVSRTIREAEARPWSVIFSFGLEYAAEMARREPRVPCLWLQGRLPVDPLEHEALFDQAQEAGMAGIAPFYAACDPGFARAAHRRALAVWLWTVNDLAALDWSLVCGADAIISDRPDLIGDGLRERCPVD